jgi:hypothetical protein
MSEEMEEKKKIDEELSDMPFEVQFNKSYVHSEDGINPACVNGLVNSK